jgi:hypothetical protein
MNIVGINSQRFLAQSTQENKAKATEVSISDILKAAIWSTSTFCMFHYRPVYSGQFGTTVQSTDQTDEL